MFQIRQLAGESSPCDTDPNDPVCLAFHAGEPPPERDAFSMVYEWFAPNEVIEVEGEAPKVVKKPFWKRPVFLGLVVAGVGFGGFSYARKKGFLR